MLYLVAIMPSSIVWCTMKQRDRADFTKWISDVRRTAVQIFGYFIVSPHRHVIDEPGISKKLIPASMEFVNWYLIDAHEKWASPYTLSFQPLWHRTRLVSVLNRMENWMYLRKRWNRIEELCNIYHIIIGQVLCYIIQFISND